jgi:hypothetical protein
MGARGSAWAQAAAWRIGLVATILVLALSPHDPVRQFAVGQDKLEHMIAFAVLAVAMCWSLSGWRYWAMAACVGLFTIVLEVLQLLLVHTRSASIPDAMAGLFGVGLGLWAQRLLAVAASRSYNRHQA